jgi:hypothetical protein
VPTARIYIENSKSVVGNKVGDINNVSCGRILHARGSAIIDGDLSAGVRLPHPRLMLLLIIESRPT